MPLKIKNHGPLILETNFWGSQIELGGHLYCSINAGAFRILLPRSQEAVLAEMRTATTIVVSRGPWPDGQQPEALEVLFDDGTDEPFAIHFGGGQFDRLSAETDAGREFICTVWTAPRRGKPHKALERPAWFRLSPRLPDLRPWAGK